MLSLNVCAYSICCTLYCTLKGTQLDVVDQSEVRVTVGDGQCEITSFTAANISCVPPQSGVGIVNVTVCQPITLHTRLHCVISFAGIHWTIP